MTKLRPLFIFGTRPEAIPLPPVIHECRRRKEVFEPVVCLTGQHSEMLEQVVEYFQIKEDANLSLMMPNQSLAALTARCIDGIDELLIRFHPDCIVAQGDTTTVMAAALAAFYRGTPLVHVEAGLRTGNLQSPWPEELNRRIASLVTSLHCAPTTQAANALLAEGISPDTVHVTGNTVIDALLMSVNRERNNESQWRNKYAILKDRRTILITAHRRESFGSGFENICRAIRELALRFPDCAFVYPVHLNPNVRGPVHRILNNLANVHLIGPAPYPEFVWLMDHSVLILTDSGGVQEEAPSLQKPVLVMRETTERPEAVTAGAARLVGTSLDTIVDAVTALLSDPNELATYHIDSNPYGDGHAAERIAELMLNSFKNSA